MREYQLTGSLGGGRPVLNSGEAVDFEANERDLGLRTDFVTCLHDGRARLRPCSHQPGLRPFSVPTFIVDHALITVGGPIPLDVSVPGQLTLGVAAAPEECRSLMSYFSDLRSPLQLGFGRDLGCSIEPRYHTR